MNHSNKGQTLLELLIYVVIFSLATGVFSGVLVTFTRVQGQEAASSEVTQQLSFIQSTIQRLVREAVNIENPPGATSTILSLRMAATSTDPTIISSDENAIYLKQGTSATSSLTNDRVKVSQFEVVKYENPGGHAVIQVDLSLTYNSLRLYQQVTRNLKTAIGRVTAATFDDNLQPNDCTITNQFTLGLSSCPWKYVYLSDGTFAYPSYTFGANTGLGLFRAGDNVLGFSTAGAERMRIDSSGNVGIGTTSPGAKLQVGNAPHGISALDSGFSVRSDDTGYAVILEQASVSNTNEALAVGHLTNTATTPVFQVYGGNGSNDAFANVRFSVLSGGNVGIGTTDPGSYRLKVAGTVSVNSGTNIVYRCTTAGTLPIGALTINSGDCGASADTGLSVN